MITQVYLKRTKDIFIKIKPVIETLNNTFQETMSPFKGRSRAKQYLKKKPRKWGFKAWLLAASIGYVHKLEMYQGKRDEPTTDLVL